MPTKTQPSRKQRPEQRQTRRPGIESRMTPRPISERRTRGDLGKLAGKVALITGGDSGIGRAVALAFAKEGAQVAISYLNEKNDADETAARIAELGGPCLLLPGDIASTRVCERHVAAVLRTFGRIDILVNNAAEQHPQKSLADIDDRQLERTFATNIYSFFRLTRAALPHLKKGAAIINTTSVTAYRGSAGLIDYSATKGAVVSFTRSLALSLVKRGIRVNAVAPGVDAPDSFNLQAEGGRGVWIRSADGARGRAGGDRPGLSVPRGGRALYDRPGAASEWWRGHQRVIFFKAVFC
jgi:NAD(P)-dependent dehydrogenase (short-subunit alcohol dehydrogenase family)